MRIKKMFMIVLAIGASILWGCGTEKEEASAIDDNGNLIFESNDEEEIVQDIEESNDEEETAQNTAENNRTDDSYNTKYYVGNIVTFESDNGGIIDVTLTDWGKVRDYLGNPVTYVKYKIENVGSETVTVGSGLFELYADDYSVENAVVIEDGIGEEIIARNLSAGRKLEGVFYKGINPDSAASIEVECGGSVFVLKDGHMTSSSDTMLNENGSDEVNLPPDLYADSDPIELYKISGYYGGMMGQSTLSLSLYSSMEGLTGIGYVEIYVEGGQYAYNGEIDEISTNVYEVSTDTGEDVLLVAFIFNDVVELDLCVDGQLIEEYLMMEHYE